MNAHDDPLAAFRALTPEQHETRLGELRREQECLRALLRAARRLHAGRKAASGDSKEPARPNRRGATCA